MLKRDEHNIITVYNVDDNLNQTDQMKYGNTLLVYNSIKTAMIILEERYAACDPVFINDNGDLISEQFK